ncbi:hypothetical protein AUK40_01755 [Candidatus Wirthbacteria bacterium CG2_30_54_11]|uniref:RNA polymerase sigma factor n=1 Tax=Candidatus Wirthbacteria bacterium CG2_30_54_11 TaxID=1817892 RepID=A0A1J5INN5_9BACT|nr:MAG: hypothetical protein AUK40_01755 [Candidatus Wirthbacteria bacterium CG2_30_54_11]
MNDEQLVAAYQQGDQQALISLYDRYIGPVFRFIRKRVATATEAEDLTQDVFLEVCSALSTVVLSKGFRPWLYGIAQNKVKSFWTREYAMPVSSVEALMEDSGWEVPAVETAQSTFSVTEEKLLSELLRLLPENQAQVIYLRFYKEYSRQEVAEALSTSENTVKVWQYRALQTLRDQRIPFIQAVGGLVLRSSFDAGGQA